MAFFVGSDVMVLADKMRIALIIVLLMLLIGVGCSDRSEHTNQQRTEPKQNMSVLVALIAKIKQQGNPNDTHSLPILVSLEDFFEGNNDFGSIGPNLVPMPGPEKFYTLLKAIRGRADVQDVLIRISAIESEDMWPFSNTVYILTSAPTAEVASWLKSLKPDEVYDNSNKQLIPDWPPHIPFVRELRPGARIVYAWWD